MMVILGFHSLAFAPGSVGRALSVLGGGGLGALGLGRLWTYLKARQRARVRLDGNVLSRENALWREIGELKAQVRALESKIANEAKVRDWLVDELGGCRLTLLMTMGEVNAERLAQGKPPKYDLSHESHAMRQHVPPDSVPPDC